jgi:tetratricopeptide (TPR) repeat protein
VLADPSSRTISPLSSLTVPSYIENRISEGTTNSLDEAQRLALENEALSRRISEIRAVIDRTNRPAVLQREAKRLADRGRLEGAEAKYREALQSSLEIWTNEPLRWESSIRGLMDVLRREGKNDEVEQVFGEILTPSLLARPDSAVLLRDRGNFLARRGRWKDAVADFSRVIELDPSDHGDHHSLAPLLVQSGDWDGYRKHCAQVMGRFGGAHDPVTAERMAKDCLILPDAGIDLKGVAQWADTAVSKGAASGYFLYFEFAKGLAEYRQGHFASAMDWVKKALVSAPDEELIAQSYLVLAMAQHQSGELDNGRASLAKGAKIIETSLPKLESGDIGDGWTDWIIAHTLLNEAETLFGGTTAAPDIKK